MAHHLIIAIGNIARGDDGVAHDVAARLLAEELPPHTRVLSAVGLDVAMATDVASTDHLIVVDAERRETPAVEIRTIEAGTAANSGHAIDAPGLLAVTRALWDATPLALLVSVAAPEMGHGEGLSAIAMDASEEAVRVLLELVREG